MSDEDLVLPTTMPSWIQEHVDLYLKDPQAAHMWDSAVAGGPGPLPTLLLIATGRKTGKRRALPLLYREIDGRFVIIASKGGAPEHPAWYENLVANPECEVRIGERRIRAKAVTVDSPNRERLWREMVALYPPYEDYQKNAGERQIPVVALGVLEEISG